MSSGTKGSWEIPNRSQTGVIGFENPLAKSYWNQGSGQGGYYGFNFTPEGQDYYNQLTTMRNSILSGLGYTAPSREASLNEWQDTFTKEALRTSMPQLEQTLFARGMGGSKLYQDSVTDLLNKVATQSVLNREQLASNDEYLKLAQLASINPEVWNMIDQGNQLTSATAGLTEQQYANMLPYMANYNQKSGTWDLLGGGLGALAGLALGGPTGAAAGYSIGSGVGNIFNTGGQSGLGSNLSNLAQQYALSQMFKKKLPISVQGGGSSGYQLFGGQSNPWLWSA